MNTFTTPIHTANTYTYSDRLGISVHNEKNEHQFEIRVKRKSRVPYDTDTKKDHEQFLPLIKLANEVCEAVNQHEELKDQITEVLSEVVAQEIILTECAELITNLKSFLKDGQLNASCDMVLGKIERLGGKS